MEKGKKIEFDIPRLLSQNYVYDWDSATIKEGTDKKQAFLDVTEDCNVVAYVGSKDYKLKYKVITDGGKVGLRVNGGRPKDPNKKTPRDEWEKVTLPLFPEYGNDGEHTVNIMGGDTVIFLPKPEANHVVDYWLITKSVDGKDTKVKDYDTPKENGVLEKNLDIDLVCADYYVEVAFRDYYLLKYKALPNEESGKLEVTKIKRGTEEIDVSKLEKVMKTDVDGKEVVEDGKPVVLGYKIRGGDVITFTATPASGYEVDYWDGLGYDDGSNKDPTPKVLTRDVTVTDDLNIKVRFDKPEKK